MATCQKCSGTNWAEFIVGQRTANSTRSPVTASRRRIVGASIIFCRSIIRAYVTSYWYLNREYANMKVGIWRSWNFKKTEAVENYEVQEILVLRTKQKLNSVA
jgi:hypothetical protein